MKYIRPRLPEKEIELCLDLFDKEEAKKRILNYITDVFNDAESQFKNCFILEVSQKRELLAAFSNYCNSFNIENNCIMDDDIDAFLIDYND